MAGAIRIRPGGEGDGAAVLALWDTAIAWMVERGQEMQWGTRLASEEPRPRAMVREWETGEGLRLAELDGRVAGASVIVGTAPNHVPATARAETYLLFLVSHRAHAGNGIGAELVRRAAEEARAAGSELLRVDCWAGAPDLVAWYERQGFSRSGTFTVDVRGGWHGQVLEMWL